MASPVLQLQGVVAAVTTGDLTVTIPAGEQADDILVITTVAWVVNTASGANTIAAPSGWTKFTPNVTTITATLIDAEYSFFWRRAAGSDADPVFVRPTGWDTGNDTAWAGRCYVIRGATTTGSPWDAITNTAVSAAANPAFPAITVSGNERMAIVFAVKTDNTAFPTAATGYTVGKVILDGGGTDSAFNSYRVLSTNSSVSAVTPTGGVAPAQGGTVYFGVSFIPQPVQRTATGSGFGTQSAAGVKTLIRTATGSGTGTSTADTLHNNIRSASGSGGASPSATANGLVTRIKTATGSGTGSETSTGLHTAPRAATGSGLGTDSATRFVTRLRTATGSGAGMESSTKVKTMLRTATGSGIGTDSTTEKNAEIGINWATWGVSALIVW